MLDAYSKNKEESEKERITIAYIQAMWTIQWLGKQKPKSLQSILGEKKSKPMTDEELLNKAKTINLALGGEIVGE